MGPAQRLRLDRFDVTGGAIRVARLGGLVALLWATASEHHSDGSPRVPAALLTVAAVGWLGWLVCAKVGAHARVTLLALAVMAAAGGAVGGLAPVGIAFPAIAVIATATLAGVAPVAVAAIAALGGASLTIAVVIADTPTEIITEGWLAIAAAVLGGASRRQYQSRAAQAEQLLAERVRADTEHARAGALAERNRIGREMHDVLAHSLGALSVQLEAADALLEGGADAATTRDYVQRARRLALDGLAEARNAVRALRDEPLALCAQLATLASADGAELSVTGTERRLAPDAKLALFRAAQEALSNVRKHAPGAAVT